MSGRGERMRTCGPLERVVSQHGHQVCPAIARTPAGIGFLALPTSFRNGPYPPSRAFAMLTNGTVPSTADLTLTALKFLKGSELCNDRLALNSPKRTLFLEINF